MNDLSNNTNPFEPFHIVQNGRVLISAATRQKAVELRALYAIKRPGVVVMLDGRIIIDKEGWAT